jgi:2-succinyl-5-enolpyruvyl-6-hydroxy-3-cyclohexene-1-carboxylate synthase
MRSLDARNPAAAAPNRNFAFAAALFEELQRAGVRHACVCPGSRSSPLAVAIARSSGLRAWTHVDERAAAFFALGLAKTERCPVALVCTSGTAAANFLPAVVEAHYARVPLLVLTADRPHEVRDFGAPQTIDQVRLYGSHVRWFAEAAIPEPGEASLRYARALACRAVAEASGVTPGPVHLNLPFREPLDPRIVTGDAVPLESALAARGRPPRPYTRAQPANALPSADEVNELAELARSHARGVIACGPLDLDAGAVDAVVQLGVATGWPILAEPTAQLRSGAHVTHGALLAHADLLLRNAAFASAQAPDVVLRIGPMPTSKAFRQWIERHPPEQLVVVDPGSRWEDPSHQVNWMLRADPALLAERVARQLGSSLAARREARWIGAWLTAEKAAQRVLAHEISTATGLGVPALVQALAAALPDDALLYVASSMAVRDVDLYWPLGPRRLRVLCNRGANGIDGVVSSALGAAAAHPGPCALLTGDLAFLHDAGGLLAAHRHRLGLTIVVVNDDGGGIFSLLPIAEFGEAAGFETFFRTPHGLDLATVAQGFGAHATRAATIDALRAALTQSLGSPHLHVIEVPLDRALDVATRRRLEAAVSRAVARAEQAA